MKILITIPFTEEQKKRIEDAAGENELIFMAPAQIKKDHVADAEVIMGNPPVDLIREAKCLKWLQLNSAGADTYCIPGILGENTVLTNASGAYDTSVSEWMLAATFALFRKLYSYYNNQKQRVWHDEGAVLSAGGACVVVLGLGNIGLAYARKMKALGSYVIGVKRHPGAVPEGVDELHTMEELEECLKRADIVAAVLPGTPETRHLMGKAQFAAMKKTAYFLNAGRGNSVDTDALYDALESGEIAGAALDVMEEEPLPSESRLWTAGNLYITPHISGGYHISVTLDIIADICAENLKHYQAGETLRNVVDRKLGY